MKKQQIIAVILLTAIISTAIPLYKAQQLSKPTVNLPSQWKLEDETPYPNAASEHDPAGAGKLEYVDQDDFDVVKIYYEKAPNTTYSNSDLEDEAVNIFQRENDLIIDESGVKTVASVSSGYAKGYDSELDTYTVEYVFIKSDYYFNIHAYYDATSEDENQAKSIMDSISVGATSPGSLFEGTNLYIVIGIIVAVVVVIIVVAVAASRRKKKTPQQPVLSAYPPPPPPT